MSVGSETPTGLEPSMKLRHSTFLFGRLFGITFGLLAIKVARAMLGFIILTALMGPAAGQGLSGALPEQMGLDGQPFDRIEPLVEEWIDEGNMAGCVVAVGYRGKIVYIDAFGHRSLEPQKKPMTVDTVFDLASLTKPIATATSIIRLVDQGRLRLHDPVARYLPEFAANGKEKITIFHLLTHQGGLIPDNPIGDYEHGPEEARRRIMQLKPLSDPGEKFRYTDVGYIVLGWVIEKVSGKPLDQYVRDEIFGPLGMDETWYVPSEPFRRRAAATEKRDGRWMQGEVHDPRAHRLGGVAGHAGLFSTAGDLAIYAQMMLQKGQYRGVRILSPRAVEVMTRGYRVSSGWRGLGWDKQTGYSSNRGEWMTESAFGHGGFTGTAIWIDPRLELFVIFLSNRLHPDGKGSVNRLAGRIGTLAAASVLRESERQKQGEQRDSADTEAVRFVQLGIDVLRRQEMTPLLGKRVGLITNHTGVDRGGELTSQILHKHPNVKLVALFSPEHGIAGKLDQAKIGDVRDPQTGLPVFSLYGKTRKPTANMLADIDVLVFDIQDIGCRFYTYISTMGLAMEAAAEHGKAFVVLDRPNPIGGMAVEGPLLDAGKESFVGYHTLPIRHGMTIGELARLFKAEKKLELDLTVIPMRYWSRRMLFRDTYLRWINPSPNMRSPQAALLYPGIGLLETTNVSVGRGTDRPFEVFGAPWIDGEKLVDHLKRQAHPGVSFAATTFTPTSSKYTGEACRGVAIKVDDEDRVEPVRLGMAIAVWLRRNYPEKWQIENLPRLLGNQRVFRLIRDGADLEAVTNSYSWEEWRFDKRRKPFLLYR